MRVQLRQSSTPRIYLDQNKLSDEVRQHLERSAVLIRQYEQFYDDLRSISSNDAKDKYSVGSRSLNKRLDCRVVRLFQVSPTCNSLVQQILGKVCRPIESTDDRVVSLD